MSIEEKDQAYHTLVTCDGKGKEAKAEALRCLIEWHRDDAVHRFCFDADVPGSLENQSSYK